MLGQALTVQGARTAKADADAPLPQVAAAAMPGADPATAAMLATAGPLGLAMANPYYAAQMQQMQQFQMLQQQQQALAEQVVTMRAMQRMGPDAREWRGWWLWAVHRQAAGWGGEVLEEQAADWTWDGAVRMKLLAPWPVRTHGVSVHALCLDINACYSQH